MGQQYKIIIGDWSSDGHGRTETVIVEVTSPHSLTQMQENYRRNCERWGYTLDNVADDCEDNSVPPELTQKMRADNSMWTEIADRSYGGLLNGEDDDELILGYDTAATFVMDFIGLNMPPHNGEEFAWHEVEDTSIPLLTGGYSAKIEKSFGYGLFFS